MGRMPPTARERVRAELTAEITDAARRQLAEVGAAALSLRAVAREVGMVSSAVYRYFPSRDELLTRLIIESYDALGAAAEEADDPSLPPRERWLAVCRAVRGWAVAQVRTARQTASHRSRGGAVGSSAASAAVPRSSYPSMINRVSRSSRLGKYR